MFMIILCISQQTSTSGRSHTRSQVGGQRLLLLGGTFWLIFLWYLTPLSTISQLSWRLEDIGAFSLIIDTYFFLTLDGISPQ